MKRVNIRYGLKQRMNEILGTDSGVEGDVPGITAWSVQAAMLDNLRRIAAALTGDSQGRPMRGLWLTKNAALSIAISAGYGFTPTGDVVILNTGIVSSIDGTDGTKYIYLRHRMAAIDGDTYDDGKKTGFIGKAGTQDIAYDDFAASKKDAIQTFVADILTISSTLITGDPDLVYVGSVIVATGDITTVTNSTARGLAPNDASGRYRLPGIHVNGDSTFENQVDLLAAVVMQTTLLIHGKATFNGGIVADGSDGVTDLSVTVRDAAGTGTIDLQFKNGIFIGIA